MDNTLVYTNYANYIAYKRAVKDVLGGNFVFNSKLRLTREVIKKLFPNIDYKQYNAIIKLKEKYYSDCLFLTKLNLNLVNLLKKFKKTSRIVLVSSSRKIRVHQILDYYKDDIPKGKFFNKYEYALYVIGVDSSRVIIYEDDLNQVKSALNFGIPLKNIVNINIGGDYEKVYY
ncbi:MAG: hypothetical protein ABIL47_08355 [candidate division WOR-3 bacterium]